LAADGKFLEAAEISRATSNMPEICPRVCPQERLCEGACVLNSPEDAICIGAIEKFINEYALAQGSGVMSGPAPPNGLRVAVVGSGPGGLACADELAVTVFESGGCSCLASRPSSVVERRVNILRHQGPFKTGVISERPQPRRPAGGIRCRFSASARSSQNHSISRRALKGPSRAAFRRKKRAHRA
jgi:glutamate synthase (NADPH/NADH) small chain